LWFFWLDLRKNHYILCWLIKKYAANLSSILNGAESMTYAKKSRKKNSRRISSQFGAQRSVPTKGGHRETTEAAPQDVFATSGVAVSKEADRINRRAIAKIRRAVADYMSSEGCSCCRAIDMHEKHAAELAKLLGVPKYSDGSGFNFPKFRGKK